MTFCYDFEFFEAENSQSPLFIGIGAGDGNRTIVTGIVV